MKVVTICSSANFYRHVIEIVPQLEKQGYKVLIPANAKVMQETGNFDTSHYKTWFDNKDDYHKKAALMRKHFAEVENGDMILVVNDEKNGIPNYIGGNVLIEMALAFYLNKPIFLLNDPPAESAFLEEIHGMGPISLHGDIGKFPELADKPAK